MQAESETMSSRNVRQFRLTAPLLAALVAGLLLLMPTSSEARVYVRIAPPVPIEKRYPARPRLLLASGLLGVGRGPLCLAPWLLCPSSIPLRGLGRGNCVASSPWVVLDAWTWRHSPRVVESLTPRSGGWVFFSEAARRRGGGGEAQILGARLLVGIAPEKIALCAPKGLLRVSLDIVGEEIGWKKPSSV